MSIKTKHYRFSEEEIGGMILPHGSGFDCKWEVEDMGKYWRCKNSFHCMDEQGGYDGYADFTVIMPKKYPDEFRLHFNGKFAARQNYRYGLREYMEDTLYHAITECMCVYLKPDERPADHPGYCWRRKGVDEVRLKKNGHFQGNFEFAQEKGDGSPC